MWEVAKLRDPKAISLSVARFYWWKTKFGLCPEMQRKENIRGKMYSKLLLPCQNGCMQLSVTLLVLKTEPSLLVSYPCWFFEHAVYHTFSVHRNGRCARQIWIIPTRFGWSKKSSVSYLLTYMVRHPRCVFINYDWINQLLNTTIWWLGICCLLQRYQLHVSALMAIFRLTDWQQTCKQLYFGMPNYSCLQVLLSIYQPEDGYKSRNMELIPM